MTWVCSKCLEQNNKFRKKCKKCTRSRDDLTTLVPKESEEPLPPPPEYTISDVIHNTVILHEKIEEVLQKITEMEDALSDLFDNEEKVETSEEKNLVGPAKKKKGVKKK